MAATGHNMSAGVQQVTGLESSQMAPCNGCVLAQNDTSVASLDCSLYTFIVNTVLIGLVCVVGLVGNMAAFTVFCKDTMKTSSSFLFQALSLIDSAMLVLVFLLYCFRDFCGYTGLIPAYTRVEPYMLVVVYPCAMVAQTSTIWVTVLVGVNRYIAVCKPYQAPRLCTVTQAKKQLAAVLAFALLYNIPKFAEGQIKWTAIGNGSNLSYVPSAEHTAMANTPLYNIIYNNILYIIFLLSLPLVILTMLNIRLINALKALRRKRAEMQSLRQQQDNNVTLVLVVVILVFTVCQVPALVNQVLWNALPDEARGCGGFQFYFRPLSNMLVAFNSAVNFFIYFAFNSRFRNLLKTMLCRDLDYQKVRNKATSTNSTYFNNTSVTAAAKDSTQQSLL